MAELKCPECGSLVWDEQRVCPECGAILPDEEGTGDEFPLQERFAGAGESRLTAARLAWILVMVIVVVLLNVLRESMMHPTGR
jgi:hypothetical protein